MKSIVLIFNSTFHITFHNHIIGIQIYPDPFGPEFIVFFVYYRITRKNKDLFHAAVYGIFGTAYKVILKEPDRDLKDRYFLLIIILNKAGPGDNLVFPIFQGGITFQARYFESPIIAEAICPKENIFFYLMSLYVA